MNIKEWLLKSSEVVKQLAEGINYSEISLKEAEERISESLGFKVCATAIEAKHGNGREGLKQKTEWKECNIVVIEKYLREERVDRWVWARYGPRKEFEEYVRSKRRTSLELLIYLISTMPVNLWRSSVISFKMKRKGRGSIKIGTLCFWKVMCYRL